MPGKFQKRNAERKGIRKEYELEQKFIKEIVGEIQVSGGGAIE
jgi:predicted DNA-binding ribbon-helix-helix protein